MKLAKQISKLINESLGNISVEVNNRYKKFFNNPENKLVIERFLETVTNKIGSSVVWINDGYFQFEADKDKKEELSKIIIDSLVELRKTASSLGEAKNDRVEAIQYFLNDQDYSDKELENLYIMAKGEKKSDFKSAKKILDKLTYDLKYTVDGFGLQDIVKALEKKFGESLSESESFVIILKSKFDRDTWVKSIKEKGYKNRPELVRTETESEAKKFSDKKEASEFIQDIYKQFPDKHDLKFEVVKSKEKEKSDNKEDSKEDKLAKAMAAIDKQFGKK